MSDRIKYSVRQFIDRYRKGMYKNPSVDVQIDAGWYDWFCKDEALARKTEILAKKLISILPSELINLDRQYVFFKNNCPVQGRLYDDFRICSIHSGDVIWTVTPKCSHSGMAEVWGKENDFKEPIVKGSWKDVKAFFKAI